MYQIKQQYEYISFLVKKHF